MSSETLTKPPILAAALRTAGENSRSAAKKSWFYRFGLAVCCWSMPLAAHAATFIVNVPWDAVDVNPGDGVCETAPGNRNCTLRAAVMEANRAPGSTIELSGTATLAIPASGTDDERTGDLNISASLSIVGGNPAAAVIDANGPVTHDRAIRVDAGVVTITGVTIRNGDAEFNDLTERNGGAVYVGPGSILSLGGSLIVTNNAASLGGGVYVHGGNVVVVDSTVRGNHSREGGGLYKADGALTIRRSIVEANMAEQGGGGVADSGDVSSMMLIVDSAVINNDAMGSQQPWGGGGLRLGSAGPATIQNVTIDGNHGHYGVGGGIYSTSTSVRVLNSTISSNSVLSNWLGFHGLGGGVYGGLTLENTILADNFIVQYTPFIPGYFLGANDCDGTITSSGYNLLGTVDRCTVIGAVQVGDPKLGPLQDNGGPTPTRALLSASPAIDAGDPAGCRDATGGLLTTDQRGFARPFGGGCDLGAFEFQVCRFSIGSQSLSVPETGAAGVLAVAANDSGCAWNAVSSANWISVPAGNSGSGSGTVAYTVLPNPGGARSSWITIAGLRVTVRQASHEGARGNFDVDRRTDIVVYRPSTGTWYILKSSTGFVGDATYAWGTSTDVPVAADYDGDGRTDIAVYRPSTAHWFILKSSTDYTAWDTYQWGITGDIPVPGDYDGDGKTDIAIYRPSNGVWSGLRSSSGFTAAFAYGWGDRGDVPVAADYDGDGTTDIAVYRPSTGYWYILTSSTDFRTWDEYHWGTTGDIPVPADYDGDTKADIAQYRPSEGTWYILKSSTGFVSSVGYAWGASTDLPVPGDYGGDGMTDIAVYRPDTGLWFILTSSSQFTTWETYHWGSGGDAPIAFAAYGWLMAGAPHVSTFVVNVPWDGADVHPGDGVCETLPGSGICTLRAAIMEANRTPGSIIDVTGTVTLSIPPSGTDDETTGDLNIVTTMTIVGGDPATAVIDANGAVTHDRAIRIEAGVVTIAGVTIRNGQADVPSSSDAAALQGGAVYVASGSTLSLRHSVLYENTATDSGGGLYVQGGTVSLDESTVQANSSTFGGGIYKAAGVLTIKRSTIGGVAPYSGLGNSARQGGGLYDTGDTSASTLITESAVINNIVDGEPGSPDGVGGGLYLAGTGSMTIQNVTISGNSAPNGGAGILAQSLTPVRVINSTISYNSSGPVYGAGVNVVFTPGGPNLFTLQNAIVYGNRAGTVAADCSGTIVSIGNNLLGSTGNCELIGAVQTGDPKLGPLQDNGGPTATRALLPESAAIDAGDPDGCRDADGALLTIDQRGSQRPRGSACDLGAFETVPPVCQLLLSPASVFVQNLGTAAAVSVTTNDGQCPWNAISSVDWVTVMPEGGSGTGTVRYTVLPNPGPARSGMVAVGGAVFTVRQASHEASRVDFDGDRKADVAVYRPSTGAWYILNSNSGFVNWAGYAWGASTDVPVPGDYDGDGRIDITVYRPGSAKWFILKSSTNYTMWDEYQWGTAEDTPVPGDYDGDGKTDIAIYRPSDGTWYILQSSTGFISGATYPWGSSDVVPVPGDYDGDGKTDPAVYQPSTSNWYIRNSSVDTPVWAPYQLGSSGDIPVPADYDGDGKADIATYRPGSGEWHVVQSGTGRVFRYVWGASDDMPVPADYDGDGNADLAVYRPTTGQWFILKSSTHFTAWDTYQFGIWGDVPIPKGP